MSAISTCLRKYATFSGRATRHEFWMFYLFMNIVLYVPLLIGLSLLTDDSTAGAGIFFIVISIILTIGLVFPIWRSAFVVSMILDRVEVTC